MICVVYLLSLVFPIVTFRSEYLFNFDEAFEIHDDIEVLKRMGLSLGLEKGECLESDLTAARKMVPKVLEPYVIRKRIFRTAFVKWAILGLHLSNKFYYLSDMYVL